MAMRWHRLGLIFCPDGTRGWMRTHAANPTPLQLAGSRYRVYFSPRDAENRSSIGWVEIDLRNPREVLAVSSEPVLGPGALGAFDDSGTTVSCLAESGGTLYLYYLGWNLGTTVPWRNAIGLATSVDGLHFTRTSPAPLLDRNHHDPYSLSYPFVLRDGEEWRMWYGSNLRWGPRREMQYAIKYAASRVPDAWSATGTICIDAERPDETAFARPSVLRDGALWRMWYSMRGAAYRIGYAESEDGILWTRRDAAGGLEPPSDPAEHEEWESEEVAYPYVFDHDGRRYMLYNGNRYGLTGFGLAVLD